MHDHTNVRSLRINRLLYQSLPHKTTTLFEVQGGHHGFDSFPNPRAFAMLDCMKEWLTAFIEHRRVRHAGMAHA